MKKITVLSLLLFILTGCTATYNMNINEDYSFDEELIVNNFQYYYPINEFNTYVNTNYSNYTNIKFEPVAYSSSYALKATRSLNNLSDIDSNKEILENFGKLEVDRKNRKIIFTPNEEKCINAFYEGDSDDEQETKSNLTINITLPYKVKSTNLETNDNSVYSWVYDDTKCNEIIFIRYEKIEISEIIMYGVLILIVISVIMFFVIKSKKVNEI